MGTLKAELVEQNSILSTAEFVVSRVYTISVGGRTYSNAILDCSLQTQALILSLNSLLYAGRKRYVHEFVNLLQCTNCLSFGHLQSSCTNQALCKKCAEPHPLSDCTSTHFSCANCITHNKTSANKFLTDHSATSDKCQSRIKRIEGLKTFLSLPKN